VTRGQASSAASGAVGRTPQETFERLVSVFGDVTFEVPVGPCRFTSCSSSVRSISSFWVQDAPQGWPSSSGFRPRTRTSGGNVPAARAPEGS
jgi:hypothetical protein